jgi:predicted TIM-barrel fold metal-dependent hydrolase
LPDVPTKADRDTFLRWVWADEILVFASDYPHWDWDEPSTFLTDIDPVLRHKMMYTTAHELYQARLV